MTLQRKYSYVLVARLLEVAVRFLFLTLIVRFFSTEEFGQISMTIAVAQGLAAFLFSASLQTFSFLDDNKKRGLFNFLFYSALGSGVVIAIWYPGPACIYAFYSVLYLMTGWFTGESKQTLFSFLRASAFVPPLLVVVLQKEHLTADQIYFSFLLGVAFLALSLPFASFKERPYIPDLKLFVKFQAHNFLFQGTKVLERFVFQRLLDSHTFGLYSMIRDFTNAVNLTFFSSFYQLYFKKAALMGWPVLRAKVFRVRNFIAFVILVTLVSLFDSVLVQLAHAVVQKELPTWFFTILLATCCADIIKALGLMIVESKRVFRSLIAVDFSEYGALLSIIIVATVCGKFSFISGLLFLIYRLVLPAAFSYKLISYERSLS